MPPSLLSGGLPASFQIPRSTAAETLARATFTQLMWALSYPGRHFSLPAQTGNALTAATFNSCLIIGNTLLDLESSFYTPDPQLANALARSGARAFAADSAAYHFYPTLATLQQATAMLATVRQAMVGSLLYPDQSATLVIGCKLGVGTTLNCHGPGIPSATTLRAGGLPTAFWQLRAERVSYPLGWDLFLVDGDQLVGLPRTTVIEVESEIAGELEGKIASPAHLEGEK